MIADIGPADFGWVHALNKTHEKELSPLTPEEVQAVARKYLDIRRSVTGWLIPEAPTHANDNAIYTRCDEYNVPMSTRPRIAVSIDLESNAMR